MATEGVDEVVRRTRVWLERVVLGLDLCPFARRPYEQGTVRIFVSPATTIEALMVDLAVECGRLAEADPSALETTLLVHPDCLTDFAEYNDALEIAEAVLADRELDHVIKLVAFHPELLFEATAADAIENYTNRSPYPMLHLLRVRSVERAAASHPDVAGIPARNNQTLSRISRGQLDDWLRGVE